MLIQSENYGLCQKNKCRTKEENVKRVDSSQTLTFMSDIALISNIDLTEAQVLLVLRITSIFNTSFRSIIAHYLKQR
jgi:hypothetical protein